MTGRATIRGGGVVLCIALACLPWAGAGAAWLNAERAIMGTAVTVELWSEEPDAGRAAVDAVIAELHRIDQLMSTYKPDSEISAVNAGAATEPVTVGAELFDLIGRSLELSELTGGAFDISYASVGFLYDYRAHERPGDAAIAARLDAVNFRVIRLDPETRTVAFGRPGMRIDLGGIAKGYAVERGAAVLRAAGIRHAIVTAGGDSRIVGDRRGKPWVVGIRDPRHRNQLVARLPLANEAISTSGDYERYFEEDGVRYHHIINPRTGDSARSVHSVTIIGPDATLTDGLSTSVFVLGVAAGIELIETVPGYEAVIVDGDGRLHRSSGFE